LRGADIVVLNDHDAAGYAHADAACRLSLGVAARVRRLDLAPAWQAMPSGADVSDWLAAGHGGDELSALIASAPDYIAETAPPPGGSQGEPPGEADDQPTEDEVELSDDEIEFRRLAKMPLIEYERARKAAADALGMRAWSSIGWSRPNAKGYQATTACRAAPWCFLNRSHGMTRLTASS
jgi:hypothetical protein